jgi:hypothetical protein
MDSFLPPPLPSSNYISLEPDPSTLSESQLLPEQHGIEQVQAPVKKAQVAELKRVGMGVADESARKATFEKQYDAYCTGKEETTEVTCFTL